MSFPRQVGAVPGVLPYQIQIRHLTALLQIHSREIDAVIAYLGESDLQKWGIPIATPGTFTLP